MNKIACAVALMMVFAAAAMGLAAQNMGAKEIVLEGGKPGTVPFPHHQHQENIKDCKVCHDLFPQEPRSIEKLKAEGKLKKKKVMNFCQKCHRERAMQGQKAGPVTCTGCHVK